MTTRYLILQRYGNERILNEDIKYFNFLTLIIMWKTYKVLNFLDEAEESISKANDLVKSMRKKGKKFKYDEYEDRISKK